MFKKVLILMLCVAMTVFVVPHNLTVWATSDDEWNFAEDELLLEEIEEDVESDLFSFENPSEIEPESEAEPEPAITENAVVAEEVATTTQNDIVNEEIEEPEEIEELEGPDLQKSWCHFQRIW